MKKISGYTLIELMIVLLIASILITAGIPMLKPLIQQGRVTTITNELVSAMYVARSEAIRKDGFACVCSSSNSSNDPASTTPPACNAGNNWEQGWISFYDNNGNCVLDINADPSITDVLLKAWDGSVVDNPVTVRNDTASINAVGYVRYNSRGQPKQILNNTMQQGVFSICDERGDRADSDGDSTASAVIVNASGSIRSSKKTVLITCP